MRVHGPMPKLTLHVFLDPRSNKLSTVKANWTKNYPEVDNSLLTASVMKFPLKIIFIEFKHEKFTFHGMDMNAMVFPRNFMDNFMDVFTN